MMKRFARLVYDRHLPSVGIATAVAAAACAAVLIGGSGAVASGEDSSAVDAVRAAALVQATSGPASSQVNAVGTQAKAINAALPFSSGPISPARPFVVPASGMSEQRALECLTQAVYYEAGFEPEAGRRAVAQVVLNRLRHPAFPKSVCGVVYQRTRTPVCQFTFVCDGALYRSPEPGAWRQARAIAAAALAGHVERSVGVATHYHADYVAPRWAPLLAKVAQIGAHIFYRWPGAWGQPQAFRGRYIGEPADSAALRPSRLPQEGETIHLAVAQAGPPVPRAPNDVGGLLDTSKGWTLNIPSPTEAGSAASRVMADQQRIGKALPVVAVASATAPATRSGVE